MADPYRTAAKVESDPPPVMVRDSDSDFDVGGVVLSASDDEPRSFDATDGGVTPGTVVIGVMGMVLCQVIALVAIFASPPERGIVSTTTASQSVAAHDASEQWTLDVAPQVERERERDRLKLRVAEGKATATERATLRELCRATGDRSCAN